MVAIRFRHLLLLCFQALLCRPEEHRMARTSPDADAAPFHQLTPDDWEQILTAAPDPLAEGRSGPPAVDLLAEALAPRLAEQLSQRIPRSLLPEPAPTTKLLTLDQLVTELPPAKPPQTWKRWLYERTRRGDVPGCVKPGGMLFFERESTLAWLRAGATATR